VNVLRHSLHTSVTIESTIHRAVMKRVTVCVQPQLPAFRNQIICECNSC